MSNSSYHGHVPPGNNPEFIAIPGGVFSDGSVSHAAELVYGWLKLRAGKDGPCCSKQATLARAATKSGHPLTPRVRTARERGL